MSKVYTWRIGGPAGTGIMSAGPMFARALKKTGYRVHGYPEYPSLIRGGYNCYQIAFGEDDVYSPYQKKDIYVALHDVCFEREEFDDETFVIGDFDNLKKADDAGGKKVNVPLKEIVKEIGGPDIMQNTVALGAAAAVLGLAFDDLKKLIKEAYKEKIADMNIDAAKKGYDSVSERCEITCGKNPTEADRGLFMSGNDASSIGAIAGGVTFYSTYPMTPASSILHYLAKAARDYGIVAKHTEDEIAGVNMAIGAAFAGARAMTGTSGGGFSLMNEGLGLAAITEVPLVLVVSQRPGPATGMPTWTEQADLKFVLNASQGEFVRAVFTPGDLEECYKFTFDAFNIAEKYQIPAFIVLDKFISESHYMVTDMPDLGDMDRGFIFEGDEKNPNEYHARYKEKENGIGVRSIPGTPGGLYIAASNEHSEKGFVTDKSHEKTAHTERRFRKLNTLPDEMPHPQLIGNMDAPMTFVTWGSVKLSLLEAMKHTDKFNFIHFPSVYPLDWEKVKEMLKHKNAYVMENNYTGQLASIISEFTGIQIEKNFRKYDGRPFFVEEILEFVEEVTK
ncbi:2-oxoacid:acceptor oxidoreductase subunit alpha [Limisalsivibrio acetivorans]|uniref:2-oxoacid:acceptor oxidoreductase subunit alpha n=1 Tax=Limisalsivibrio acetivorans TaxID=1304888 RepID=UPI0003B5D18C|nr:2-oxoacid:acceptor oxidoreductase subunit alpha [Limisalsivibrio acetivorans]